MPLHRFASQEFRRAEPVEVGSSQFGKVKRRVGCDARDSSCAEVVTRGRYLVYGIC